MVALGGWAGSGSAVLQRWAERRDACGQSVLTMAETALFHPKSLLWPVPLAERRLLIGAGALARDIVELAGAELFCAVYVDPQFAAGSFFGLPVITDWAAACAQATHYVSGFLDLPRRRAMQLAAAAAGLLPASALVSASATVSKAATLAPGCVIATHVNVGAMTTIGRDVLLMHNAVIGHDSRLGNNSIVLPGAWVGGHVTVGEDVLLGANSVTAPGLSIGSRCVLAPGAACLKSLPADSTLIGNPGRVVRR